MERWRKNYKNLGHEIRTGNIRNTQLHGVIFQKTNLLGILSPQIHNSEALWIGRRRAISMLYSKTGTFWDGGLDTE